MAQPTRKTKTHPAHVASCAATDCRHNENRDCTAGDVKIQMKGGAPVCGTYESEKPKARP